MAKQENINKEKTIDSILASLIEVANTNSKLASTQLDDLLESCFTKNENGAYKPIMIPFEVTRDIGQNASPPVVQPVTVSIQVPKLTLIPITMLAIDKADISSNTETKSIDRRVRDEEHIENEFDIEMHCGQVPLPPGLSALLNIFTNTIQPVSS